VQGDLHCGVNILKLKPQQSFQALHARSWSRRRFARELGIHRKTVGSCVPPPRPAMATDGAAKSEAAKVAISTAGSPAGRVSLCREYWSTIVTAVNTGLSTTRIHQDLVADHGFFLSYPSELHQVRHSLHVVVSHEENQRRPPGSA
jgi:hypothetical protein